MNYISRYCRIRNRILSRQGSVIFNYPAGDLDAFLEHVFTEVSISYPKFYKMDRLSKLGFLGAEILLHDMQLAEVHKPEQVALVLSNAHASLDTDMRYFETTKTIASPALFVYTLTNIVAGEICIRHGIKGENAFFVSSEFDGGAICEYVDLVLATERTTACVAGWVDLMGDQHDVLLYLVEKNSNKFSLEHTAAQLQKLYNSKYGTVDGRS